MSGSTSGIGGPTASSTDAVTITGGSINAPYVSGATDGTSDLYLTTVTVPGQYSQPVTGIKNGETDYGYTGVSTDAAGKLYLWLPAAEETTVTFTIGGTEYNASGSVTAESGGSFTAAESAGEDPAAVAKAEKKAAVLQAFGALPLEKNNDKYSITGTVSAFLTATGEAETAVAAATAAEIGWTANDVSGWTGYEAYTAALTLKTQAETLKTEAISAFTAIDGTTYEAVKDALETAESKVTAAMAFGWDEATEISAWTNYAKLTAARALKDGAAKAAAQVAAEAAFAAVPAYDGSNQEALSQAVDEAVEAITAALAAGCTQAEIESWTGYSRYASAKEISEHLPTYPTVTLTVLGLPEDEEETGHYFIEPTNYTVMNSSNVAEVVTQALASVHIDCDYTGQTAAGGNFFIQGIGGQYNSGSQGWMYMVDSNAYIAYGMNNYAIKGGENILVYYSQKGYNGGAGDSSVANPFSTPYGRYGSFLEISNVAGQKNTVDLRSSSAEAVMAQDWEAVSAGLRQVRVWQGDLPLAAAGPNGSIIVWSSGNTAVVSDFGKVTLPAADTTVTLTATLYFSDKTLTKTLDVSVGKSGGLDSVTVRLETADTVLNAILEDPEGFNGANGAAEVTLNGLTACAVDGLRYTGYGAETVMAAHALARALAGKTNPPIVAAGNTAQAHIEQLLGYPESGETDPNGQRWTVTVTDAAGETVFAEDYTNNLLLPLASGDMVTYRFVAGTKTLQGLYDSVASLSSVIYSAESFAPFRTARDAAAALLKKDAATLTQAEVDAAWTALNSAYQGLVFRMDYLTDYFGGENSIHNSTLSWLTKYPAWLYRTQPNDTGRDGFIALALNGMLTDSFVAEGMKSYNHVLWRTLYNTAYPPTEEQAACAIGLTIAGYDMNYFYAPTNIAGMEEWDYPMTFIMAGKASQESATGRIAMRLTVLNTLPYADYQNLTDREQTTDLTRDFLLERLVNGQMDNGFWEREIGDGGKSWNGPTMAAMEALAPYYWEEIALPETVTRAQLEAVVEKGLAALKSDSMLQQFAPNEARFYSTDGYRLLNILLMYGVDVNDPTVIRFPCSGDVGIIDWILMTYLSEDGTHFRRKSVEEFWLEQDNGIDTSNALMMIVRFNGKLGLTMTLYRQFLENQRATYYQNKPYQNQEAKAALELKVYHARMDTLGLDREQYISEGGNTGTITAYYENLPNYTAESGAALVAALEQAYDALVHLDSTAEQIAAAEAALDAALAGLIPNTPAGSVIQQIKALTDITPDSPKADKVAAARTAYEALNNTEKAEITNYADLVTAEHQSAIATGYKNSGAAIGSYLNTIGDAYAALGSGTGDDWKVIDMAIAGRLGDMLADDAAVQSFVTASIRRIAPTTMTDYERVLLAVTAVGLDGADLTKYSSFTDSQGNPVTSLVDAIAGFDGATVVNSMVWGLLALDSGEYETPAGAKWTRAAMIAQLLDWQLDSGAWPINAGGAADVDTTAMAIVALMPYMDQAAVKAAVEAAQAYLAAQQATGGSGAFGRTDGGETNSNSTAMVLIARIAAGEDPRAAYGNGTNPVTALLSFGLSDYSGFGYTDNQTANDMATEQSFRALAAYKALAYDHNERPYYFGKPTDAEPWGAETVIATVTFHLQGGTSAQVADGETKTYKVADAGAALPTVTREGYRFLGWFDNPNGTGTAITTVSAGLPSDVYAVWKDKQSSTDKKITVYFTLLGDEVHDSDADGRVHGYTKGGLQTWIPKTRYELEEGSTVKDLFELALEENGMTWSNPGGNYVESITRGGVTIGEFTNGAKSGWMYTLNGSKHPNNGLAEQELSNGDAIVWHYTDDWTTESDAQNLSAPAGGEKKDKKDGNEVTPAQVVVAPEVAADGTAKAEVKAEDVSKALEEAPDAKTLTVKVDTEGAASVEADLPANAVRAAADAGVGLNVETEQGTVKLSAADVKAAGGKDLAVSVKSNADGTTSFEVSAGGTAVAANVKVELPAKDGQVLVIVNADGTEEVVKKCVTSDGKVYAEIPAGAKVKVADAQGMTFGDVKETDWFAGAVEFVTSRGIFQGTGDGFQPNAPMNRAMLVTVLQRIAGEKARGENTFGDVEPDAWYADAVIWASENGIVNGTDNGFEPDAPVTREQIATMLYRFMKYLGYDVSASKALDGFPDGGDTADWAKEAMEWAASVGLFKGDDNGNLNPGGKATRAEVATLVERLIGLMVK